MNTLNYSNATNRNEHPFQLLFVPLESITLFIRLFTEPDREEVHSQTM